MFCVLLVSNKQSTITFIGTALLSSKETLSRLAPYVTIFARMSPQQKGEVIASYKSHNYYTLMCGDGTNDVAALKQAHVGMQSWSLGNSIGVSIMNNVSLEDQLDTYHSVEKEYTTQLEQESQNDSLTVLRHV